MTNDEKLNYIKQIHSFSMKYRVDDFPVNQQETMVKEFNKEFKEKILPLQPHKLYKYRTVNDNNLNALENDYVWFTTPEEFDDTIDSTVNIDPEAEVADLLANQGEKMYELNLEYAKSLFEMSGLNIPEELIKKCLDCYDDGRLNVDSLNKLMNQMYPNESQLAKDNIINKVETVNAKGIPSNIKEATEGYLTNFKDINKNIQKGILTYCLAEEQDNDALWGTYADCSKGFCIEYTIPWCTDEISRNVRLNLMPIYYGTKEEIKLFQILKKSIFNRNTKDINGITKEDYEKMFISTYTKDETWQYQKEWRITFPLELGNRQHMPYVSAVIIGERMEEANLNRLVEICRKKGIKVLKRVFNISHSKLKIVDF